MTAVYFPHRITRIPPLAVDALNIVGNSSLILISDNSNITLPLSSSFSFYSFYPPFFCLNLELLVVVEIVSILVETELCTK